MKNNTAAPFNSSPSLTFLSHLLFPCAEASAVNCDISREDFDQMCELASSHHVIMRAVGVFGTITASLGDGERTKWAAAAGDQERARIQNALTFLHAICDAMESEGCDVTVIKSLDHWPDLGSDLDLYTNAEPKQVISLMRQHFQAELAPRSWGDRLANKWNFLVPGLPEAVEIHMRRLGQTGEQVAIAGSLPARARALPLEHYVFQVAGAEDRIMISTMQRMYRHFYFRLCDIVDTARLLETEGVDYNALQGWAQASGIWEGVATYLAIVADYVAHYRGTNLDLPGFVRQSASFGGEQIYFSRGFLRLPILPQSARLYASQLKTLVLKGQFANGARLGLLPCLATAAAIGQKVSGSDKGIW